MKLLVFEFITGGGMLRQTVSESLFSEGDRMLQCLLDDLLALENIELTVLRDKRYQLPASYYECVDIIEISDNFQATWLACVNQADAVWPIAPETDAMLQQLCADVEQAGKRLLNANSATVHLTGNKINTLKHLKNQNIATVPTTQLAEFTHQWLPPWVVKPNDGIGCEGCQLITQRNSLDTLLKQPNAHNTIIQPYIEGESLSLSALFDNTISQLLSINRQTIEIIHDELHLSHCQVNALPDSQGQFQQLLSNIAITLPGLWGYAGIDLMVTPDQGARVLEINPRLTTSYCDLHKTLAMNPAARVVDLMHTPL